MAASSNTVLDMASAHGGISLARVAATRKLGIRDAPRSRPVSEIVMEPE
jgi:hypothetical protein